MHQTVKRVFSVLVIVVSIAVVIIIAFSNKEMGDAWGAIMNLDPIWMAGLFICWASYAGFDAIGTWSYLRSKGYRIHLTRVIGAVLIGFYYSSITPSAAGGQPMQVNTLRKAGIPLAYGTTSVTIRFVANQFMICLISLVLLIVDRTFVHEQLHGFIWAVRIGWIINFLAVPLVLLAAYKRNWIQAILEKLIGLLARIRIIRDPQGMKEKVTEVLDAYHAAMLALTRSPGQILLQMLCSGLSMLGMALAIVFTYYAFGLRGTSWHQLLALSSLLFVSASYTPLPGASGAQEGGFWVYFNGIFVNGTIGLGLLVSRFFTYYMFLIVGVVTVLAERMVVSRDKRMKQAMKAEQDGRETEELPEEQPEQAGPDDSAATEERK